MNRQLIEIASWRIINELHRRHPTKFKVIETHPGGGMYDCLSISSTGDKEPKHIADFNRAGRLHIFERFNDGKETEPFDIWPEILRKEGNLQHIFDKVTEMLGLSIPKKRPPSTPTTLVYRFISEFLTHTAFGVDDWSCRNGFFDTSGYGGGVSSVFDEFPQAQERFRVELKDDVFQEPAYRFWFLRKNEKPVLCLETIGTVWNKKGKEFNLAELYPDKRQVWPMIMKVAGDLLP